MNTSISDFEKRKKSETHHKTTIPSKWRIIHSYRNDQIKQKNICQRVEANSIFQEKP